MTKKSKKKQDSACANGRPLLEPMNWLTAALLFWPVTIIGAALDLWSKWAVFNWLSIEKQDYYILIEGYVRFIARENEGAAFSIFSGWRYFLVSISGLAFVVMIVIFFSRKVHSKLVMFAMGCMTAGIIGNFYDRAFNEGRVRDFIDVLIPVIDYTWPTFNVADSLLCIGVGILIITNLTASTDQTPDQPQKAER
ncbi:MAG: signal peptidase II [Planctomycetota bacterium]|jgi:signal peptidase II